MLMRDYPSLAVMLDGSKQKQSAFPLRVFAHGVRDPCPAVTTPFTMCPRGSQHGKDRERSSFICRHALRMESLAPWPVAAA